MKDVTVLVVIAIICISIICVAAVGMGHDGAIIAAAMATISGMAAGVGGYQFTKAQIPKLTDKAVEAKVKAMMHVDDISKSV